MVYDESVNFLWNAAEFQWELNPEIKEDEERIFFAFFKFLKMYKGVSNKQLMKEYIPKEDRLLSLTAIMRSGEASKYYKYKLRILHDLVEFYNNDITQDFRLPFVKANMYLWHFKDLGHLIANFKERKTPYSKTKTWEFLEENDKFLTYATEFFKKYCSVPVFKDIANDNFITEYPTK